MSKFRSGKKSAKNFRLNDWHLWNEVKLSVSPLSKKTISDTILPEDFSKKQKLSARASISKVKTPKGSIFKPVGPAQKSKFTFSQMPAEPKLPDIEPQIRKKVRRGRVPIEATIDLHGMTQQIAHLTLQRFVRESFKRGDRTILVITGKGQSLQGTQNQLHRGVLRQMLPRWLAEPDLIPLVAGFEFAARHHGGEGAFYVRLKKSRP